MAQSGETVQTIDDATAEKSPPMLMGIVDKVLYSPLNLILVAVIGFLVFKVVRNRFKVFKFKKGAAVAQTPELPKFTNEELRSFDGTGADGRILIAVNGNVYDVSKQRHFYEPGGPYASFAGRDASAIFSLEPINKDEMEMQLEMQFKRKYDLVGKLLPTGEQPTNYADEEVDATEAGPDATFTESNAGVKKND